MLGSTGAAAPQRRPLPTDARSLTAEPVVDGRRHQVGAGHHHVRCRVKRDTFELIVDHCRGGVGPGGQGGGVEACGGERAPSAAVATRASSEPAWASRCASCCRR